MIEFYPQLKQVHMSLAMASIASFILRWGLHLCRAKFARAKLVKVLPHIIDTLLLLTALALMVMLSQYPSPANWLGAKLFYLVLYIGIGMFALGRAPNQWVRFIAGIVSLGIFANILVIAITRNSAGLLQFVGG